VAYSVSSPTNTPNMTQRPLPISFAGVQPNTLGGGGGSSRRGQGSGGRAEQQGGVVSTAARASAQASTTGASALHTARATCAAHDTRGSQNALALLGLLLQLSVCKVLAHLLGSLALPLDCDATLAVVL
jgi:hypothetical protein